jgi:hypothetical protein
VDVVMAGWPGAAHDRLPADVPRARHGRPVFRDDLDRHAAADQPGRPSIPGSVACDIAASRG